MDERKAQQGEAKAERRFRQEEHEMLLRCAKNFDRITGWTGLWLVSLRSRPVPNDHAYAVILCKKRIQRGVLWSMKS